jgi:DNA ligase D-like protein (predicted 3'-phosphoesterase)
MNVLDINEYKKKRNFDLTPEPLKDGKVKDKYKHLFVIQKHDATNLHYDLRIEIKGVLVSWAVPKGPSTDPNQKRLAIRTENHPLEYAEFEGIIPENLYGAGVVLIWDRGTYDNMREIDMQQSLNQGKIKIWLKGNKIQGGYYLIRTKNNKQEKEQWLLIKADDKEADARKNPVSFEPKSVVSGKTLKQIKKEYEQNI